ncbi:MAG: MFS transporter [Variovorax sp.]|nr:MAG: MFS transporter [Variovorax sp.]
MTARGLRAFADGYVALLLPLYLLLLGMSALQVGIITAGTLLGSALLTLVVGLQAWRFSLRSLLLAAAALMAATGLGFGTLTDYWPLLLVAVVGTLNASSDDASVFQMLEHTLLSQAAPVAQRTSAFARYSLVGAMMGAAGALAAGLPSMVASALGIGLRPVVQASFVGYALIGVAMAFLYGHLPRAPHAVVASARPAALLAPSRRTVYRLAALFSLDAFGGGLVIQSMLVLWLHLRFGLTPADTAKVFFCTGLLSAASFFFVARVARRLGLLNTMVITHVPASVLLLLIPLMPDIAWTIALILLRAAISSLDVPARSAYVMSIVTPPERPAAASLTSVPRSLMWAAGPLLTGYLLSLSSFGWPLMIAGIVKLGYDVLLFTLFARVPLQAESADR